MPRDTASFDEVFDVVVAGFGFAGGAAAIAAHDAGARVLLIEKMPYPGGISICAGGGSRTLLDHELGRDYLRASAGEDVPDSVVEALAQGMIGLADYFRDLAAEDGIEITVRQSPGNYPFPGHDRLGIIEVGDIPGFDPKADYPHVHCKGRGPWVFRLIHDNVRRRGIETRLSSPARRLILDGEGGVTGLLVDGSDGTRRIGARRGVILATGGFEAAPDLQRRFWQLRPVLPAATRGNTGDGLRMAQAAGADLWNTWNFHGGYGFRHPDPAYPFAIRMKSAPAWVPGVTEPKMKMSWILLDRTGRRFDNEYHPYLQDTGYRSLDRLDPSRQDNPAVPAWLIIDEAGRGLYPLGSSAINDAEAEPYRWSADNLAEVENGLLRRADTVQQLAELIGVATEVLEETLTRWNHACALGHDTDHGRPSASLVPVATPPFYVGQVWPVVNNTQGGPVHDAESRVLNPFGEPIPRLYEAGELGSIWGPYYLNAGNLAECFVTGQIAGRHAAGLAPLDI